MIKIHFLNVGHGDCTIIEFKDSGRTAVIDINKSEIMDSSSYDEVLTESIESMEIIDKITHYLTAYSNDQIFEKGGYNIKITNPIEYISNLKTGKIFRFISTHPHMDHLTGLKELSDNIGINTLWIHKNKHTQDLKKLSDTQKLDWDFYKKYRDTNEYLLDGIYKINPKESTSNHYWMDDNITILSPDEELLKSDNPNILSYVLLIEYGGKKILLGGDAEKENWEFIMDKHKDKIKNISILKASHHGRESGYYQSAVKHMNPLYTIVSVGKKPSTDASNNYRNYCNNVWSTRWNGNIGFNIEANGNWTYWTQYNKV